MFNNDVQRIKGVLLSRQTISLLPALLTQILLQTSLLDGKTPSVLLISLLNISKEAAIRQPITSLELSLTTTIPLPILRISCLKKQTITRTQHRFRRLVKEAIRILLRRLLISIRRSSLLIMLLLTKQKQGQKSYQSSRHLESQYRLRITKNYLSRITKSRSRITKSQKRTLITLRPMLIMLRPRLPTQRRSSITTLLCIISTPSLIRTRRQYSMLALNVWLRTFGIITLVRRLFTASTIARQTIFYYQRLLLYSRGLTISLGTLIAVLLLRSSAIESSS